MIAAEVASTPCVSSESCIRSAEPPKRAHEVFVEADAALAASIFHFDEYSVREVKKYLDERGIPVRL